MGNMYCGKTSEILKRLVVYHEMGLKVLYINSVLDTRANVAFSTHNKIIGDIPFDSVKVEKLIYCDIVKYDVIAIDEASFFPDLKTCVLKWVEIEKKIVIVGGLNGDYKREPFGQLLDLVPYCDTITKLSSFCIPCKRERNIIKTAQFTLRTVDSKKEILVGGKESYLPVCRDCYLKK
jgi:thymidine kinase